MTTERVSHYELRRLIGRGGMGEVYEAFDVNARRPVALKFVAPELAADPDSFRRFESEAHNAAALHHPHIATLFEFEPAGDRPFIAMELVAGPSLRDRIRAGALPVAGALAVARDVASALAYAHRRNIVHRDIKPENLMFDEEGRVKVMDFGLARALLASRLTVTGSTLGTPSYMAPESVAGAAGPPSDVFALGLVLHEMLTGRQVFAGDNPLSVMFQIANTDPPPVRGLRDEAPEAVESLLQRLLARDPATRMDAAAATRELALLTGAPVPALESAAAPLSAPGAATSTTVVIAPSSATMPAGGASVPIAPRRRTASLVLGIGGAVVVVALALVAWALRPWDRVTPAMREEAVMLNNQAFAALGAGDLRRAQDLLARSLQRDPGFGQALMNLAAIYESKGELDSAVATYGRVLRARDAEPVLVASAEYNLGDIDLRSGAYERAVERLRSSLAKDSSQARTYNNLGLALVRAKRPQDGLAVLERGLARFPGAAPLYKNAGLAALELGRDSLASGLFGEALARDAALAEAWGGRARARARLGDRGGALEDWRRFLANDPPPDDSERAEVARALAALGVDPS